MKVELHGSKGRPGIATAAIFEQLLSSVRSLDSRVNEPRTDGK
jgi:hypothetical protein